MDTTCQIKGMIIIDTNVSIYPDKYTYIYISINKAWYAKHLVWLCACVTLYLDVSLEWASIVLCMFSRYLRRLSIDIKFKVFPSSRIIIFIPVSSLLLSLSFSQLLSDRDAVVWFSRLTFSSYTKTFFPTRHRWASLSCTDALHA